MSQLKVNTIRHTSATSDAITLASDGTCTAKITNNLSNRNLIINGDMRIAQRGSSTTTHNTLCVDRFKCFHGGTDEAPTFAQITLTSSDTGPWAKGFRNALQITNGNQTGGAGGADEVTLYHQIEAQDLANSGWDYTSASSYATLSFWVKSSVAQTFYGYITTSDGTSQMYLFSTGALSANTWTKVTVKIPGYASLQFDNNNGVGLGINFGPFYGSDSTASGATLNSWTAWNGSARNPDNTTTWYTTNDSTYAITGVQLEVGDVATEFEHRSYADELARCQRYYYFHAGGSNTWGAGGSQPVVCLFHMWNTGSAFGHIPFPVTMRTSPSASFGLGTDYVECESAGTTDYCNVITLNSNQTHKNAARPYIYGDLSYTAGHAGLAYLNHNDAYVAFNAEF